MSHVCPTRDAEEVSQPFLEGRAEPFLHLLARSACQAVLSLSVQKARLDVLTPMSPDPDGIRDIIARLPQNRLQDVILIDPADTLFPYGSDQLFCLNRQSEEKVQDAH